MSHAYLHVHTYYIHSHKHIHIKEGMWGTHNMPHNAYIHIRMYTYIQTHSTYRYILGRVDWLTQRLGGLRPALLTAVTRVRMSVLSPIPEKVYVVCAEGVRTVPTCSRSGLVKLYSTSVNLTGASSLL